MSWFRRRRAAADDESISPPDTAAPSPESPASPAQGNASAAAPEVPAPTPEAAAPVREEAPAPVPEVPMPVLEAPVAVPEVPVAVSEVTASTAAGAAAPAREEAPAPVPEVHASPAAAEVPDVAGTSRAPEPTPPAPTPPAPAGGSELAALESAVTGPTRSTSESDASTPPQGVTALLDPPASTATLDPEDPGTKLEPSGGATGTAILDRPSSNGLSTATRSGRSGRRVGVDLGFADRQAVEQAVSAARSQRKPTGQVLVEQGVLRQDQLARVVAERFGLDYIDLSVYEPDMGAVSLLSTDAIKRYQAVPVGFLEDGALLLAMADPTNILSIDDIAMITNRRVRVAAASAEDVNLLAARLGRLEGAIEDIVEDDERESLETALSEQADQDAPIIKLVHSIIAQAVQQGASDIHVNPEEGDTRVLFRVDGVLYPAATVRRRVAAGMVSRIKIMADLDISERRAPQDGRLALNVEGRRIDIRVVTLPLVHGEGAVLRVLDKGVVVQNLESL